MRIERGVGVLDITCMPALGAHARIRQAQKILAPARDVAACRPQQVQHQVLTVDLPQPDILYDRQRAARVDMKVDPIDGAHMAGDGPKAPASPVRLEPLNLEQSTACRDLRERGAAARDVPEQPPPARAGRLCIRVRRTGSGRSGSREAGASCRARGPSTRAAARASSSRGIDPWRPTA